MVYPGSFGDRMVNSPQIIFTQESNPMENDDRVNGYTEVSTNSDAFWNEGHESHDTTFNGLAKSSSREGFIDGAYHMHRNVKR